ncbi:B12-binding domain-containing radical SAM protein [Candidatus Omnitrophota bacterium]
MKVVFVFAESESYSIGLFSSILKQHGHEVHLVFDPKIFATHEISNSSFKRLFDIRENNIRKIQQLKPDLVCFSVYTQDYQWSLSMASSIKKAIDVPIIFGGIHCILVPEEVIKNKCVDMICVGEGEYALLELVESIKKGRIDNAIKNLWFKTEDGQVIKNQLRPLIADLDTLPFPDKDLFYEQKPIFRSGYSMSSGRGCPFSCTYCSSETINNYYAQKGLGKYVRQRSVQNVIEELSLAKKKYNFRILNFTDDVFTLNLNWMREFAKEYKRRINVPFMCTANPGSIKDEELALLKEANCNLIGFGLQSASEKTRITTLSRAGTNKRIRKIAKLCHSLKMSFSFDHIFNIPGEGIGELVEALEFYNETRPSVINTFWLTYFPKVKLIEVAKKHGLIDEDTVEKINRGETSASLFVGVGCDYSFGKSEMFNTFAFLFTMLTFMPRWLCKMIVKKGWYRKRMRAPFLFRLAIKDLSRVKMGRFEEITFPVQLLLVNIFDNLKIKITR